MMEYAIGVYDNTPDFLTEQLQNLVNLMSKNRYEVAKIWLSYRETKVVILYQRMRVDR